MVMTKQNHTEFSKERTLKQFREEVGKHLRRRTVDNADIVAFGMVSDKEVTDIDMPRSFC
jgi:hypothetical protein